MCFIAGMHKAKSFKNKINPKITKEIKTKIKIFESFLSLFLFIKKITSQ